jgi:hypothetical protein
MTLAPQPLAMDGKCAFAVSVGGAGKAPDAKPAHHITVNGTTYGFLGPVPKLLFRVIPRSAARADRLWAEHQDRLHPTQAPA